MIARLELLQGFKLFILWLLYLQRPLMAAVYRAKSINDRKSWNNCTE